ncbi:MAG: glucose-6-phosphate isomerase [Flavobacteriales bacterium MED-G15]|nr:MAG: glucose-6-phosphate isomerase [Flavobacteriales bacterium MED-G15]
MTLIKKNPNTLDSWKKLQSNFKTLSQKKLNEYFAEDSDRAENMSIRWKSFYIDYSKNLLDQSTIDLLIQLAEESGLKQAISSYFDGEKINETEDRAVLHTALRQNSSSTVMFEGVDVVPEINKVNEKMFAFADQVISGQWKGFSGKPISHVVNIGIGGSDLGPAMVTEALEYYRNNLNVTFVSNVEGDHVEEVIKKLDPETTLFIVVSKSFTTQETLSNANTIRKWFLEHASEKAISQHFIAVSTNLEKVTAFGISEENVFPMNDWVGGRFSLWSTVGLSICLAVGPENFKNLLEGAGAMDAHFSATDFKENIPVILALITVWYNNFWGVETEAIIPYSQYLRNLPAYLQQGIMESNGKGVDRNGNPIDYQTGNIIWGASGTNAQHAFFQLMHQGTKLIPADFIGFAKPLHEGNDHHDKLMSNFFAQTQALMQGKNAEKVTEELKSAGKSKAEIEKLLPFKVFQGNRPSNTLFIDQLTPFNLGALIASYEHRIFVQGIIWNIFSYDQWGVELGKQLANNILSDFDGDDLHHHDPSTKALIYHYKRFRT